MNTNEHDCPIYEKGTLHNSMWHMFIRSNDLGRYQTRQIPGLQMGLKILEATNNRSSVLANENCTRHSLASPEATIESQTPEMPGRASRVLTTGTHRKKFIA